MALLPFFSSFLAGVLSVIEPSVIWLTQLPASSHVLELAQSRERCSFASRAARVLGETSAGWVRPAQAPGNLPLGIGNVARRAWDFAHGSPCRSLPSSVIV